MIFLRMLSTRYTLLDSVYKLSICLSLPLPHTVLRDYLYVAYDTDGQCAVLPRVKRKEIMP